MASLRKAEVFILRASENGWAASVYERLDALMYVERGREVYPVSQEGLMSSFGRFDRRLS